MTKKTNGTDPLTGEEQGERKKTRIDDLPDDVKPVIICAIDLCSRTSAYVESAMQADGSLKDAFIKAFEAYCTAQKLYGLIRNAFSCPDIVSRMSHDLGIDDGEKVVKVNGVDQLVNAMNNQGERNGNTENAQADSKREGVGFDSEA